MSKKNSVCHAKASGLWFLPTVVDTLLQRCTEG